MIHAYFSHPEMPAPTPVKRYATITLSAYQSWQGPVLKEWRDGRVTIDTGWGELTGHPLTPEPAARKRGSRIWLPLFAGLQ